MNEPTPIGILGGGISALAFTWFSGRQSVVFEKEDRLGGLCRSFDVDGVPCDIGPHIMFSRDKPTLEFMKSLTPTNEIRRSNRIFHRGRYVKYPLENALAALPDQDRDYCLSTFLENPYREYDAQDMLTFFYRKFGEGMTRLYLEPYNRKIWKFEPSFMDLQMVERIPDPPPEDVIRGARGEETEGYLHQLFFNYPASGGFESVVRGLVRKIGDRMDARVASPVEKLVRRCDGSWTVHAGGRQEHFERVVSAMPVHELLRRMEPAPPAEVLEACKRMLFNAIHITTVHAGEDGMGDNFALMVADPDLSFHRVSKMNFLGEAYHRPGMTTVMAEITHRPGDRWDMPDADVTERVVRDLDRVGFVPRHAVRNAVTHTFPYAYVIYDLNHRRNTDLVLRWLEQQKITSIGRFATFEYINSDQAILRARQAAERFVAEDVPA